MQELVQLLRSLIEEKGAITFAEYQENCLYHPIYGYYSQDRCKIGKAGDFYTSPAVHAVFGETIAHYIARLWDEMGNPHPFTLLEFGAGDGSLAQAILHELAIDKPALYEHLQYIIIERSSSWKKEEQERLQRHPVTWLTSSEECPPFTGCALSNELLDAFPVHVVRLMAQGWEELYVTWAQGRFQTCWGAVSSPEVLAAIPAFAANARVGQAAEINIAALRWMEEVCTKLQRGFIITIDYGFTADILFHPSRTKGTWRGFRQHQLVDDPLNDPGEVDLTHDVNFTALMERGETLFLKTVFFGSQAEFLLQAGILQRLAPPQGGDPFRDEAGRRNRAIKHLIFPGALGHAFKVLVQQKG